MQPLSVQTVSPEVHLRESRRFIPPSQGLLATTDTCHSAPVLPRFNEAKQNESTPKALGLKLLQLQHPQLAQQSASHYPPTQTMHSVNPQFVESQPNKFKNTDHFIPKKMEEEKRHVPLIPRRQLSFNSIHDPTHPNIQTSGRSRGQEFSLLAAALPTHTPTPVQGLRLLHYQPAPQSNATFPKLTLPSATRPAPLFTVPIRTMPAIKLLHIDSGPKMASNISISSRFFK